MCVCRPEVRTPFCGRPGCEWPNQNPEGARDSTPTVAPDSLAGAAAALVAKLRAAHAHPRFAMVWELAQLHAGPYDGPKYQLELEALEAALRSLASPKSESTK